MTSDANAETSSSTRQRLLEAAFEVFAEKGYSGTRVQEIAKRAGFTTGAIYANFTGKAALLGEAIGSQGVSALAATLRGLKHTDSAGPALHELGLGSIMQEHRPVDTLLLDALAAAARDAEVAALVRPHIDAWMGSLRRLLTESHERGEIGDDYSVEALTTLSSVVALGGFVLRALDLPRPDEDEMRAVMRQLVVGFAAPGMVPEGS